jgi:putative DNA methylase
MAIDDEAFLRRRPSLSATEIVRRARTLQPLPASEFERWFGIRGSKEKDLKQLPELERWERYESAVASGTLRWRADCPHEVYKRLTLQALSTLSYLEKVGLANRPEEIDADELYDPIWDGVNAHLGTSARSFPDLAEQLGILRWGRNPRVGDSFCGAGSIAFEAARLGCDVYASDLNPIGCMLTWGALNIVGGEARTRARISEAQRRIIDAVDEEITTLGIEHDERGNRAKAYLWCVETRCPRTGWLVPMATSWVISRNYRVCAQLLPDRKKCCFLIEIITGASDEELAAAAQGTVQDGALVYELDDEVHRTPIPTLRGDYRLPDGTTGNRLRRSG